MNTAIIVAAGSGVRMGPGPRKQYAPLGSKPIVTHTLLAFEACRGVDALVLVVPEEDLPFCRETLKGSRAWAKPLVLVPGGSHRGESVKNGLDAMDRNTEIVLIHDGVRPFVTEELILACMEGARDHGACIAAAPAVDTLKKTDETGKITQTLNRDRVWMAQTPQAFRAGIIVRAHEKALAEGFLATDDARLAEWLGESVFVVPSTADNLKITTPGDLALARALYASKKGEKHEP